MRIVLINPPSFGVEDDRLEQHLGLAYLASYLQAHDYEVSILELTGVSRDVFDSAITNLPSADVFGLNCYSTSYSSAQRIVTFIREQHPGCYISMGGPHPSALPADTLDDLGVDSVVVGEGELSFLSVVRSLKAGKPKCGIIPGVKTLNLDSLPFPNRTLVDQSTFSRSFLGRKTLSMITSRGCKFNCLHCNSTIMGGGAGNVRHRSVGNIIEEIRYIKSLGYDAIRFNDDNFAHHPHLQELLEAIVGEDIIYRIFSRLEHLNEKHLSLLAASGCKLISVGLESLNPRNLECIGKGGMLDHIRNLALAKEYGIPIRVSFMVGLPYDTDDSIRHYFSRAKKLSFEEYAVYPLIPYPGTRIWSYPEKYHYEITDYEFSDYVQLGINRSSTFAMRYNNATTGNRFSTGDVRRWYQMVHDILSENKVHVSMSEIAR